MVPRQWHIISDLPNVLHTGSNKEQRTTECTGVVSMRRGGEEEQDFMLHILCISMCMIGQGETMPILEIAS